MKEIPENFFALFAKMKEIKREMAKVIIGQEEAINHILICLYAGGHLLLESAPGLGKSLMAVTLSKILKVDFKRIQLTPDLMPQDVTGYELPVWGTPDYVTRKGPIFCDINLSDEFNRAPEKTQAGYMEPMQERKVTIGLETYALPKIFTLIGTRNPIETGGTFPIAEAILDRFLVNAILHYASRSEERRIAVGTEDLSKIDLQYVCGPEDILPIRDYLLTPNFIDDNHPIVDYIVRLVQASRPEQSALYLTPGDAEYYKNNVSLSLASHRTSKAFLRAVWVYSFGILGEKMILPEHVKALAKSLLRHRLILQAGAEFDGVTVDGIIDWLLERVSVYEADL
ncbi:MAG: AAA family ATPase [bacterium]|nr:AAA family ATPase [bacterium]